MRRTLWGTAAALAAAGALAACVSVLPEAGPPPLVYRLTGPMMAGAAPIADAEPAAITRWRLVKVTRPTGLASLSSDRIALARADGDVAVVAGARWDGPLPVLFQQVLADAIDSVDPALRASVTGEGVASAYELRTELRAFEAVSEGRGPVETVRVAVAARLVDARGRRLLGARRFHHTRQLARADGPAAIAEALSAAAGEVAADIARWTRDAIPAAEPLAPPER